MLYYFSIVQLRLIRLKPSICKIFDNVLSEGLVTLVDQKLFLVRLFQKLDKMVASLK